MDSFETPYEEDSEYIECTVCEKSIRGDTLYKIHLTSPGHLKKEDSLVAMGGPELTTEEFNHLAAVSVEQFAYMGLFTDGEGVLAVREKDVPKFEDIIHYLDYMKLDEPIIGLNYVEEVSYNDPHGDPRYEPRYTCLLCRQQAPLTEMVRHLIGRKHRQKYLEMKRPDLVTWDKQSLATQSGKVIRARAEIVERQDGRGHAVLLPKNRMNKLNFPRELQNQRFNRGQNDPQSSTQSGLTSHLPKLMDFKIKPSVQERYPPEHRDTPPFRPKDPYMPNRDMRENPLSHDCFGEDLRGGDYKESDLQKREYREPDIQRGYEDSGIPKYDLRVEVTRGQGRCEEICQREASPYRRSYPERDSLEELYPKDMRSGQSHSAEYKPPERAHSEGDNSRRSLDREPGRHDSLNRAGRQGSSEPQSKWSGFSTTSQGDRPFDLKFNVQDYGHKSREMHQEDYNSNPGPSGTGLGFTQRQVEVSRCMTDIPEPFKRFLKGPDNNEDQGKRKRKSRFSDASAEEVETTKGMFRGEYGPPNPKFGGCARPVSPPGPRQTESYQRGGPDSGTVFDLLNNIEIENVEEADFLKNKLCELLKEFKAKKLEKAGQQKTPSREVIIKEYNNFKPDVDLPPRPQFERTRIEDVDFRSPAQDRYFQDDCRERGWKQHGHMPEKLHQEYPHSAHDKVGNTSSSRIRYEEVFGSCDMSVSSHPSYPDQSRSYSQKFQEPMQPRDYRPAGEKFLDIRSSAPPLRMEQGPRMDRGIRYSNSLDKITSTLLELVKRK